MQIFLEFNNNSYRFISLSFNKFSFSSIHLIFQCRLFQSLRSNKRKSSKQSRFCSIHRSTRDFRSFRSSFVILFILNIYRCVARFSILFSNKLKYLSLFCSFFQKNIKIFIYLLSICYFYAIIASKSIQIPSKFHSKSFDLQWVLFSSDKNRISTQIDFSPLTFNGFSLFESRYSNENQFVHGENCSIVVGKATSYGNCSLF